MLKSIFGYSVYALLLQAATIMAFRSNPIIIGAMISTGAIVHFSVANNFLLYLPDFVRGVARALMPRSSHLEAQNDAGGLRDVWMEYSRLIYLVLLPASVLFITVGGDFIAVWMGEPFRRPAGRVLTILAISYQFYLVQRGVAYPILMGMSRLKLPTIVMMVSALANVGLSIALAGNYGIDGVAWGTTIPNLANTAFMIAYTARVLGVSIGQYILQTHLVPSLGIVFVALPSLVMRSVVPIRSYGAFVLAVGVSLVVYAVGAYFLVGRRHRMMLLGKLARRGAKRSSSDDRSAQQVGQATKRETKARVGDGAG
jgi:O-antigen/teichoic acid export membrane protein